MSDIICPKLLRKSVQAFLEAFVSVERLQGVHIELDVVKTQMVSQGPLWIK